MHVVSLSHEPKSGFPDFHRHPRAPHQEGSWSGKWPCEGPGAAVTNDHRRGGLQQQKRLLSLCWRQRSLTFVLWLVAASLEPSRPASACLSLLPFCVLLLRVSNLLCLPIPRELVTAFRATV